MFGADCSDYTYNATKTQQTSCIALPCPVMSARAIVRSCQAGLSSVLSGKGYFMCMILTAFEAGRKLRIGGYVIRAAQTLFAWTAHTLPTQTEPEFTTPTRYSCMTQRSLRTAHLPILTPFLAPRSRACEHISTPLPGVKFCPQFSTPISTSPPPAQLLSFVKKKTKQRAITIIDEEARLFLTNSCCTAFLWEREGNSIETLRYTATGLLVPLTAQEKQQEQEEDEESSLSSSGSPDVDIGEEPVSFVMLQ